MGLAKIIFLLTALLLVARPASAQLNSAAATVNLNAILQSGIVVSVNPGNVNFSLVQGGGISDGDVPVTVTTTWLLRPGTANLSVYAYFTSSASALSDGFGNNIPSSRVSGSVNGGAYSAFTGNSPFAAGSSITVFSQNLTPATRRGTRNDNLALRIDTTALPLPSGNYSGVLYIQAQAL
ncbi:MAG TPA: hypothetical protein VNL38_04335 [Candidatus Nitrosotenuis sp.]|nr:hypothetical protein [Candidatus Nitrosotenuis sp.]